MTNPRKALRLPITLAYAKGAYTAEISIGRERAVARLLLDSGSSTLVVLPRAYDPARDADLVATSWAQQVNYGQGAWAGPVLRTSAAFGEGIHSRVVNAAHFALVQSDAQDFRDADGILGLAYTGLNTGHDATALLAERNISPALTWPWPFTIADPDAVAAFRQELLAQPRVPLTPLFSELEDEGVVADQFALLVRRALVHVLDDAASDTRLAADSLNRGELVVGGGAEFQELYRAPFENVRIVHDLYYNVNLLSVQVGSQPPIAAPPLDEKDIARAGSNAILDTGSTFLVLEASLYDGIVAAFGAYDARFPQLIAQFQQAFGKEQGLPNAHIDTPAWPPLHLTLEGEYGEPVRLTIEPGHYWQHNALHAGQSFFLLMRQLPHWPKQSILGLPLMSGHYVVFDRSRDDNGVVRFARARDD
jgi:hypothetical protein